MSEPLHGDNFELVSRHYAWDRGERHEMRRTCLLMPDVAMATIRRWADEIRAKSAPTPPAR